MKPDYHHSKIYVALPAMDELAYLPRFMECIKKQSFKNFELIVCVNQPNHWWHDPDRLHICRNNEKSMEWLKNAEIEITVIDKSSEGHAWTAKKSGVGWARKVIMDNISLLAKNNDIIISLDADTIFQPHYFQSVIDNFNAHPEYVAISVPYYHPLNENENTNRHMLRYEIYMRYYALNLWRIKNPYNFSALGSAIALPVWAYKRVGGISPHKSGEDFYFLLKLRKFGQVNLWNTEKVFPAGRYSNRVFFGTGPAMIKGAAGDWSSYPIYDFRLFDNVKQTFDVFGNLYTDDVDFPMKDFLANLFKDEHWYVPLRKNTAAKGQFIKACQHKVDALRILQYLKLEQQKSIIASEEMLARFILELYKKNEWPEPPFDLASEWSFDTSPVELLDALRNYLALLEENYQKNG